MTKDLSEKAEKIIKHYFGMFNKRSFTKDEFRDALEEGIHTGEANIIKKTLDDFPSCKEWKKVSTPMQCIVLINDAKQKALAEFAKEVEKIINKSTEFHNCKRIKKEFEALKTKFGVSEK